MKTLSCDCDNPSIVEKVSIGSYNDHFHFIQCDNCKKRTKGRWTEDQAIKDWEQGIFFNAPMCAQEMK